MKTNFNIENAAIRVNEEVVLEIGNLQTETEYSAEELISSMDSLVQICGKDIIPLLLRLFTTNALGERKHTERMREMEFENEKLERASRSYFEQPKLKR